MNRAKRSLIWKLSKEQLINIVSKSNSISEILNYFGLSNKGGNYKTLKQRLINDSIDYSHIRIGFGSNKGRKFKTERNIKDILIENSKYKGTSNLKKRLFKLSLLEEKCSSCQIGPLWNNKFLSLQLDHINGNRLDNRIENLRILCPNCHSQTNNFAGKKNKKNIAE